MVQFSTNKLRISSGMRPTGQLHLGHVVGALKKWVALQDQYQSFHFIADWHALTSDYADTSKINDYRIESALSYAKIPLGSFYVVVFYPSQLDILLANRTDRTCTRAALILLQ